MAARSHVSVLGSGQPIELPRPGRAAAPLAALALVAALLALVPDVPGLPAAIAAVAFSLASATRAGHERRALAQLRTSLDRLIVREVPMPLSPVLSWRCGELTSAGERERLAASIARIERAAASSHLPGSAPFNRGAIRAHGQELDAITDRLLQPEPVSARGVLLVRRLLDDPAGPLFDRDRSPELGREIRQALKALDESPRRTRR
jgi:hypothetical protein